MYSVSRVIGLVLTSILLAACATMQEPIPDDYLERSSVVELTTRESGVIEGAYKDPTISYSFHASGSEDHWNLIIRGEDGAPYLEAIATGKEVVNVLYEDGLAVKSEDPSKAECRAFKREEAAALKRLAQSDFYASLPRLSRALAMLGASGQESPASLPIHLAAITSERIHGPPERFDPNDGEEVVPYRFVNPYASQVPSIAIDDHGYVTDLLGCNVSRGPFGDADQEAALSARCSEPAKDCGDRTPDPNDDCRGQCGPGCSDGELCWVWVCGDCCVWKACKDHDDIHRKCTDAGFDAGDLIECPGSVILGIAAAFRCGDLFGF